MYRGRVLLPVQSELLPGSNTTSDVLHILVCEENPADVRLIEEAIRECGYRCQLNFACSYAEAEQRLATRSYHLLLSFFGNDTQAATTFLQDVRIHASSLPIILISA